MANTEHNTSRRLFLAAGSAATVFGSLKAAAAVDPVFELIEAHRAAFRLLVELMPRTDVVAAMQEGREVTREDLEIVEAAGEEEMELFQRLKSTPPQTVAGIRALINYIVVYNDGCLAEAGEYTFTLKTLLRSPVLIEG